MVISSHGIVKAKAKKKKKKQRVWKMEERYLRGGVASLSNARGVQGLGKEVVTNVEEVSVLRRGDLPVGIANKKT